MILLHTSLANPLHQGSFAPNPARITERQT